ncbi:transcriptional regulator, CdaR family [Anaerovirgula multivorans]|uniref:Transcriptional regulator, CdaR family n=1 Tax=Anaerovirgula multivorans TaxID=312168 RepID=A0A239JSC2_9FIRM|nr:helix-turn-helix domain-containing protein [Anaerovirgula multivorans]SNT08781.1 transcriptional regulator, CdaR family [Anaerovirgula multivorans]
MHIQRIKVIIQGLKSIIDTEINLLDESGYIFYSTDSSRVGNYDHGVQSFDLVNKFLIEQENYIYCYCQTYGKTRYVLSIKGINHDTRRVAKIIEIFLDTDVQNISREDFIRSLLLNTLENNVLEDLCGKYHIIPKGHVQVIIIEVIESLMEKIEEIVMALLPNEIFVKINNKYFAIVKEANEETDDFPTLLSDTILSELLYEVKIGVGAVVNDIKDWHFSYQTAESFILIGKIFSPNKKIYTLKSLSIPLVISRLQLNDLEELMKQFNCNIEDVFSNNELMTTAFVFFKNNLNISDAARHLFIHRNTLIYRLNKIYDITGYDLRLFEDATLFNVIINGYLYLRNIHS